MKKLLIVVATAAWLAGCGTREPEYVPPQAGDMGLAWSDSDSVFVDTLDTGAE